MGGTMDEGCYESYHEGHKATLELMIRNLVLQDSRDSEHLLSDKEDSREYKGDDKGCLRICAIRGDYWASP